MDGYLLQFSEIEAYGHPVCDKKVLEDAIAKYMDKAGDENVKAYTDAQAALEDATLTQSQANDFAEKLLALVPVEEETTLPETDAPTEPVSTDSTTNLPTSEITTAEDAEDSQGCASAVALSVLMLLPLGWLAFKKKKES